MVYLLSFGIVEVVALLIIVLSFVRYDKYITKKITSKVFVRIVTSDRKKFYTWMSIREITYARDYYTQGMMVDYETAHGSKKIVVGSILRIEEVKNPLTILLHSF